MAYQGPSEFDQFYLFPGGGIALGGLVSLLFLRRRAWPVLMGGGFGVGVAYTNCEKSLNEK